MPRPARSGPARSTRTGEPVTDLPPSAKPEDVPNKHFPALLHLSPQPISLSETVSGRYIEVNQAWLDFFGYARAEVIGKLRTDMSIWISTEERARLRAVLDLHGAVRNLAGRCRKKSGELADVLFTCDIVEFDGVSCMFAAFNDVTAQVRAEKLLKLSEERFGKIFEAVPQCITIARMRDSVFIEGNAACETMYGYTREELVGRSVYEIGLWVDPAERVRLVEGLAPGETRSTDTRFRHKSGRVIDAHCAITHSELDGEPVVLAVSLDITDRKRAEQQLKASEERFSRMIESSPQAVTISRVADGTYLHVNRAGLARYGYTREEMIGRSSIEMGMWVDPGGRARLLEQFEAGQAVASMETLARRKDGKIVETIFTATLIELDGETVLHGISIDLSEIKHALRLQQQSEERFTKVFRTSIDPIAISSLADGRYMEINDAWCRGFGYSREEVLGRTSLEMGIWIDAAERERVMGALRAEGFLRNVEVRMRRRDGAVLDMSMSADTLELDGVPCAVSVVVDYTERNRSERLRNLSEERFTKVFRASPNPIAISKRRSGVRVDVNDAWLHVFGYTRAEAIGRSLDDLDMWPDAAERARFLAQLKAQGALRQTPLRLRRKSGDIADLLVSLEPIELDGEAHLVVCLDDITERMRAERHIEYLATRDHLTGLPNRLLFADRLRQAMAKAEREHTRIALLFIDLDHFKDVNDALGHPVGDRLLIEVAERLRGAIRAGDTLARQGGDEFLVLIDGLVDSGEAEAIARKLVDAIALPVHIEGRALAVSCSLGISIFPDDTREAAELMRNADMAMYAVKGAGRDGYQFYAAEMNTRLTARLALENELRVALERDQFELRYQPKIDLHSRAVTGCEALLRWHHPGQGLTLPARFIGIAEESRLIVPIGAWVMRQACVQLRDWLDRGMAAVPVAVNLSVQQFEPGLPDLVAALLREHRIDPALLEIEITETVMMSNSAAHMDIARRLKALGVRMALDDFGTGYSSLAYLRQMDIDVLKIDQSFVRELPDSVEDGSIIAAITAMALQFHIKVVAEGVESQAQFDALKRMNCAECQGFLFSEAVPAAEFERLFLRAA